MNQELLDRIMWVPIALIIVVLYSFLGIAIIQNVKRERVESQEAGSIKVVACDVPGPFYRASMHYIVDTRTRLCFAKSFNEIAVVPCSSLVRLDEFKNIITWEE